MKQFILISSIAIVLVACNTNGKEGQANAVTDSVITPTSEGQPATVSVDTSLSGCYSMIEKRDTASFQLEVKGSTATGPLTFHPFEKDRNDGTFQGDIEGNILTGWYLFKSEGVMSIRQVIWKIQDGTLIPGYGDMKERNDSSIFVDPTKLQFDNSRSFVKVKCIV